MCALSTSRLPCLWSRIWPPERWEAYGASISQQTWKVRAQMGFPDFTSRNLGSLCLRKVTSWCLLSHSIEHDKNSEISSPTVGAWNSALSENIFAVQDLGHSPQRFEVCGSMPYMAPEMATGGQTYPTNHFGPQAFWMRDRCAAMSMENSSIILQWLSWQSCHRPVLAAQCRCLELWHRCLVSLWSSRLGTQGANCPGREATPLWWPMLWDPWTPNTNQQRNGHSRWIEIGNS